MRFKEFRTDEFLPALGVAARAGAKAIGGGAKAIGGGAKKVGGVAKQAGKTVAQNAATKAMDKASDIAANKLLKVGQQIPVAGKLIKIDSVDGDEVTLADPKNPKGPKTVLGKDSEEIKTLVQQMLGQEQPTK